MSRWSPEERSVLKKLTKDPVEDAKHQVMLAVRKDLAGFVGAPDTPAMRVRMQARADAILKDYQKAFWPLLPGDFKVTITLTGEQ